MKKVTTLRVRKKSNQEIFKVISFSSESVILKSSKGVIKTEENHKFEKVDFFDYFFGKYELL